MVPQQSTESPTVFMSPVLHGVVFDYYFEELSEHCLMYSVWLDTCFLIMIG
jgi:hypothetical protein